MILYTHCKRIPLIKLIFTSITLHIYLFFFPVKTFNFYSQQISIMQHSIINYSHLWHAFPYIDMLLGHFWTSWNYMCQIWRHFFHQIFFYLPPSLSRTLIYTYVRILDIVSRFTEALLFFSLISLCFSLRSFYCPVFSFINLLRFFLQCLQFFITLLQRIKR